MGFERISFDHLRSEGALALKSAGWFSERVSNCVGSRGEGRWQTHGQARIDLIHFGLRREVGRSWGREDAVGPANEPPTANDVGWEV